MDHVLCSGGSDRPDTLVSDYRMRRAQHVQDLRVLAIPKVGHVLYQQVRLPRLAWWSGYLGRGRLVKISAHYPPSQAMRRYRKVTNTTLPRHAMRSRCPILQDLRCCPGSTSSIPTGSYSCRCIDRMAQSINVVFDASLEDHDTAPICQNRRMQSMFMLYRKRRPEIEESSCVTVLRAFP